MTEPLFSDERIREIISEKRDSIFLRSLQPGALAVLWSLMDAQRDMGVPGHIAEIGVHFGGTLSFLSMFLMPDEQAHAFDIFVFLNKPRDECIQIFLSTMRDVGIPDDRVKYTVCNTAAVDPGDMIRLFGGKTVRMMHVDGDHSKEGVLHDMHLATAVTRDDGIIVADDLFNGWYPGVTEGLLEYLRSADSPWEPIAIACGLGPISTGASKLVMAHRNHANLYKRYLTALNGPNVKMSNRFASHDVLIIDFENGVSKVLRTDQMHRQVASMSAN